MTDAIAVTDDGAVRTIRINRPEKKNALTLAMYLAMTEALREADRKPAVRCVLFAGTPDAFTAGNDLADFMKAAVGGLDPRAHEFITSLARAQKPMVAAVNGVAVGLGTTMLLHCDYVVAGTGAKLMTPFLKLGLVPEAASTLLAPMRMGHARAFALLAMGRPLSAQEAKDAGLVNTVVSPAEVDGVALKAAQEIAALPARAIALTRGLMRAQQETILKRMEEESKHYKDLLQSDEARAAFQAFFARTK
jgi:enoyl-CoA hydratase/carnithine racemase